MITVDHEQGMASDHGEIWIGDEEIGINTVVTMMITDDNELAISYENNNNETISVYVPLERFKSLLEKA